MGTETTDDEKTEDDEGDSELVNAIKAMRKKFGKTKIQNELKRIDNPKDKKRGGRINMIVSLVGLNT